MSNNLWLNQSPFTDTRGGPNSGGGGYGEAIQYRSPLDAMRANAGGRQGEAEYADGYLGSDIVGKQSDKLQQSVTDRMTDRNYQRGVHAGAKMNRAEYEWPMEFSLESRLEAESYPGWDGDMLTVPRAVPVIDPVDYLRHGGSQANMTDPEKERIYQHYGIQSTISPDQVMPLKPELAKEWLPPWSTP